MPKLKSKVRNGKITGYQYVVSTGKRKGKTVYFPLSEYTLGEIMTFRELLNQIEKELASEYHAINPWTLAKLKDTPTLFSRLTRHGFLDIPHAELWTLRQLYRAFIEERCRGLKEGTIENYNSAFTRLYEYFGDVTLDRLDQRALVTYIETLDRKVATSEISDQTVVGYLHRLNTFFRWGVERGALESNPLDGLSKRKWRGKDDVPYIGKNTIKTVFEVCDTMDAGLEYKLLFALARFQGLRIPSEAAPLKWSDLKGGRLHITSPKTEHVGKSSRNMPIQPETLEIWNELRAQSPHDQVFVFRALLPKLQKKTHAKALKDALERFGVPIWNDFFHALRKNLLSDAAATGVDVTTICRWTGNTPPVAAEHYLRETAATVKRITIGDDDDFSNVSCLTPCFTDSNDRGDERDGGDEQNSAPA